MVKHIAPTTIYKLKVLYDDDFLKVLSIYNIDETLDSIMSPTESVHIHKDVRVCACVHMHTIQSEHMVPLRVYVTCTDV